MTKLGTEVSHVTRD